MRCKVGDLAVVVQAARRPAWVGRIVRVLHPFPPDGDLPSWVTNPMPDGFIAIYDSSLKPLRDEGGEDETLTWCPRRIGEQA
jgi:hypothetical protein